MFQRRSLILLYTIGAIQWSNGGEIESLQAVCIQLMYSICCIAMWLFPSRKNQNSPNMQLLRALVAKNMHWRMKNAFSFWKSPAIAQHYQWQYCTFTPLVKNVDLCYTHSRLFQGSPWSYCVACCRNSTYFHEILWKCHGASFVLSLCIEIKTTHTLFFIVLGWSSFRRTGRLLWFRRCTSQ